MSYGVSEVQDFPYSMFMLVSFNNTCFDLDASLDQSKREIWVTVGGIGAEQPVGSIAQELKVRLIGNNAMLDGLGKSRTQMGQFKCFEGPRIDQHGRRGVERANEVLPSWSVDARFAANGGVDHGE
jgi:hypothetical protein